MNRQLEAVQLDLVATLTEARAAYRQHAVESASARQELPRSLDAAKVYGREHARRFGGDMKALAQFEHSWATYGVPVARPEGLRSPASLDEAEQLWATAFANCRDALRRFKQLHGEWMGAEPGFFRKKPPEPRLGAAFFGDLAQLRAVAEVVPGFEERERAETFERRAAEVRTEFGRAVRLRDAQLHDFLSEKFASIRTAIELLGPSVEPWDERFRGVPQTAEDFCGVMRLGRISSGLPSPYARDIPCVLDFPGARGLAVSARAQDRTAALELLRSIVLRVLMAVQPGQLQVSFIDPTARGQTFAEFLHLTDHDERLVDVGVKTGALAIERCLSEQASHVETVLSKYLRGQFENIHEYNRHAGEMTEPLRLVVVADFPRSFTDQAVEQLLSIVENGPRSGVYTLFEFSPDEEQPRGVSFDRLTQSTDVIDFDRGVCHLKPFGGDRAIDFEPDRCPDIGFDVDGHPSTDAARVLASVGAAAKRGSETTVTLENFLPVVTRNRTGAVPDFFTNAPALTAAPDTWWSATTSHAAVAPIGRSGAQSVASLSFSSTAVAGGAIMVGLPRSGKTTALHSLILTMSMLYSPDELELYLIDAKHGVEFKIYETLPHARMVSVHSEREFSVAVLKSLQSKIRERAELIKREGSGYSNLTEYRRGTGEPLPRIVVVIDEFHEIFEETDSLGSEAFAAFNDIVRMGAFSGVHIVVASQTLSGMPAMDRQVLTLLPQRVAFMCNEYDAEIVMGDTNRAPRMLSKTGQGLFNPARGDESKNQLFQGLYVPSEARGALVQTLRDKADRAGWTARPRVFDGDSVVPRPNLHNVIEGRKRLTVPVGEPFSMANMESVSLPRARGGNVLIVGDHDHDEVPDRAIRGVVHSFLWAAAAQHASLKVVDFIGEEEDDGCSIMDLSSALQARYARASMLGPVLRELREEVLRRSVSGDYGGPTVLLALFGLQRALSLTPEDPYADEDGEVPLGALLSTVVKNGPEVGVHVLIDADRSGALDMRIGDHLLAEFGIRIAGSGADKKDLSLVGGSYGDIPALRTGQLLVGDVAKGVARRVRGYELLSASRDLYREK